jgi:hypothetical protein
LRYLLCLFTAYHIMSSNKKPDTLSCSCTCAPLSDVTVDRHCQLRHPSGNQPTSHFAFWPPLEKLTFVSKHSEYILKRITFYWTVLSSEI